ncbi:MAG: tryptophan 2,3-dioxygenase [Alphaproteobacteria bacterium]|nr:tryptophan 2,3-dioxygenase [Alphaproteobacteria bacterium]
MSEPSAPPPTYWDYLRLDRLLDLQDGLGNQDTLISSDELHFIIVHQVYELWFKLALAEIRLARNHLASPRVPEASIPYVVHHLRRINEILRLAVDQFRLMETLTPQDFLDFRDKLTPSSGFQSFQMREVEILLGLEDSQREIYGTVHPLDHIRKLADRSPAGALAWGRIEAARGELTLRAAMHDWLHRTPIQGSTPENPDDHAVVEAFIAEYLAAGAPRRAAQLEKLIAAGSGTREALTERFAANDEASRAFLRADGVPEPQRARVTRIRAAVLFIESYRDLPLLAWPRLLLDTVVELEELLILWRTRHARMVERTIGRRVGTGGSSGVDYLDKTTRYRIFHELWAVRTLLSPRAALPALKNEGRYGFAE